MPLRPIRLITAALTSSLFPLACSDVGDAGGANAEGALVAPVVPATAVAAPRDVPAPYQLAIRQTLTELESRLGLAPYLHVDTPKVEAQALALMRTAGKDLDEGYRYGVRAIQAAYPVGHLVFYPRDRALCGTVDLPRPATSLVGACTQPYGDHAVVTAAVTNNPLGLAAGDEIVAVDGRSGQTMMDAAFAHPMCELGGSPSPANRRAIAATTLLATVKIGSTIAVRHVNGAVETKSVTALQPAMTCKDPFGRDQSAYAARATVRPDGAAVLHIPSWFPADYDEADAQGSVDRFMNAIRAEVARVSAAPLLVIDLRGNSGGYSYVALSVAGGLPGARSMAISQCRRRIANSSEYTDSLGDPELAPSADFAVMGKVAVLADGLSFSATDYFLRAAATGTNAVIVGRPSAGAFGSSEDEVQIAPGPGLDIFVDPERCTDPSGRLLEGQSTRPHLERDLDPASLAHGLDGDVEAAVAFLRAH